MARGKKKEGGKSMKELLVKGILEILKKNANKELNYKQVAAMLLVKDPNTRKMVGDILDDFVKTNIVSSSERGKYRYKQQEESGILGVIDMVRSGSAYLITDNENLKDIYIAAEHIGQAFHGDKVKVKMLIGRRTKRAEGKVVEVVQRAKTQYVGTIKLSQNHAFLIPDSQKIHVDFYIPINKLNGALDGQKVIVSLAEWGKSDKNPVGHVEKVLGFPGENNTEIHAILAEFDLPYEFSELVEESAAKLPTEITEAEIAKRKDFRTTTTFTIDPFDAKDFDDALSFKKLENGHYEIGIHIADVSHYVTPSTILDKEALNRATSVYLVDRVVPMLPETLSNQLCSLRPNEDKLCFSAVFEIDDKTKIHHEWYGRTIIHSDRRFTYEEAQEIIETGQGDFSEEILTMDRLAKAMRKARVAHGAIEFGSDEVKFRLDETGKPTGVYRKVMKDSNKLIEEFMLLANRKVAELFSKPKPAIPFVYRVHDLPDPEKLKTLKDYIKNFGHKLEHLEGKSAAYALNQLLKNIEGTPEEGIIKQLAVRTMAKAVYTIDNIGHYGLAFEHYTHFTSPIRRYPDVMVHRLLQYYLDKAPYNEASLLELHCKHSSGMERKAVEAERASIKYMQVKYLKDHIGEEFDGTVSGLSNWGMYVELDDNRCEGMINLRDLDDDYYSFDESKYKVVGRISGNEYHLGNRLRIRVRAADLVKKQLDFQLVAVL